MTDDDRNISSFAAPLALAPATPGREKRNIQLIDKRTTMVLERYMWQSVDDLLDREAIGLSEFCQMIDRARIGSSLASATRMVVLTYFRLLHQINSPPFWDNQQPAGLAEPAPAAPIPSVLHLAVRRFSQEEGHA